jgi:ABC-type antimicrobial peptide transport system permease subunit
MALASQRHRLAGRRRRVALTTLGIGLGLIGAVGLANAMASMLFGVTPGDVLPYAIVVVLTLLVVVPALLIPARRAISVDPIQNLKQA